MMTLLDGEITHSKRKYQVFSIYYTVALFLSPRLNSFLQSNAVNAEKSLSFPAEQWLLGQDRLRLKIKNEKSPLFVLFSARLALLCQTPKIGCASTMLK